MNDVPSIQLGAAATLDTRAPYSPPTLESAQQSLTTLLASGAGEDCDPLADPEPTPAG